MTPVPQLSESSRPTLSVVPTEDRGISPLLLGPSKAVAQLWLQMRRIAPHFRAVLLTGEPGCGEEEVARELHGLSPVRGRGFLVLSAEDAEARLTHLFTRPVREGMILLRGAEKLSRSAQAGLQTLLRDRSQQQTRVAVYARHGLRSMVSAGQISAELASTLGAVNIALPALRERTADLPMLLHHLIETICAADQRSAPQMSPELLLTAAQHSWPGNYRQLKAAVQLMLREHADPALSLSADELIRAVQALMQRQSASEPQVRMIALDKVIVEHVQAVLMGCHGNKLRAAEVLGISRSTLYRMLDAQTGRMELPLAS